MEQQTANDKHSLFQLRDIKKDFSSLKSIYKDFALVERIVLLRFLDAEKKQLQAPIYVWQNNNDAMDNSSVINLIKTIDLTNNKQTNSIEEALQALTKENECCLSVPVWVDPNFNGIICFEKNSHNNVWTKEEITFLKALSTTVVVSLLCMNDKLEQAHNTWIFSEVMNQMHSAIYVTDLESDEILYMNDEMRKDFQHKNPIGQKCYHVLRKNKVTRCADCPKNFLIKSEEEAPSYTWEFYNEITNKTYKNHDGLMHWIDGRMVHFQHSTDISEHRRLYTAANYDELTGSYNRLKVKEKIKNTIIEAKKNAYTFCVCMFDINDLKTINDTYGHLQGDALIEMIASTIQSNLNERDYMGRLSGDEFIIVFINSTISQITQKMNDILDTLHEKNMFPALKRETEFCFGVVQVNPEDTFSVKQLLSFADERMYESKRSFHIQEAEHKLLNEGLIDGKANTFVYQQELLYDALMKSTDDYIYICNMETGVFCYSQAMVDEFGLPSRVIENAAVVWGQKVHENDKQRFLEANQEIVDGRSNSHNVEYRAQNRNGEWVWLRCRGNVMKNKEGKNVLFAGFITNMGKKNKVDNITGLFNKYEFEETIEHLFRNYTQEHFTLMLLNIDDFKRINALNNRTFGDGVIRFVGQKIQSLLKADQSIYRLDGDEFGIVIRNENSEEANELFQKIQNAFKQAQTYDNRQFYISLSCGCAIAQKDAKNFQDLNKYADYALNQSKLNGKNRIVYFCEDILFRTKRSLEIIEILRNSVENNFTGFCLYYQPIMTNIDTMVGAEALARFHCAKFGNISPVEFIPLLEQSGLITKVGAWIFEEAVKACKRFTKIFPDFKMGINLSMKQIENMDFPSFINDILSKYELDNQRLIIELTESCIAQNVDELSQILQKIRSLEVMVSMDDFGTGYSSLGLLKAVPIDIIKIDRTFVKGIKENVFDHAFINLVVELCNILQIETLLEGVEEMDEYEIASQFPLDYYQGYLFGYPICEDEFYETFIKTKNKS